MTVGEPLGHLTWKVSLSLPKVTASQPDVEEERQGCLSLLSSPLLLVYLSIPKKLFKCTC